MLAVAVAAAEAAGQVLLAKFGGPLLVQHKGEVDLVTEADREAEAAAVACIRRRCPRHDILAEEGDYASSGASFRWIIDPLDGTTNFAHRFPWFAVSIACARDSEIIAGVVYNPCSRDLFTATKDGGAFRNGSRLAVSTTERLDRAFLATGFPYDRKVSPVNNYDHFVNFQGAAQACRRAGAASLDLAWTAAGSFDGYWEMKLKPWDVAAGILLVEEAGGMVTDFDGQPCDIFGDEYLASNRRIHAEMRALLTRGNRPPHRAARLGY
ncbi:MAG: inositol monophosphatase [Desulfuromonadales bacterium GWD2_61_12]|nr:MAG: inositol monophosphatase [Desulfuromonadales bacterium GWC2_61_20]OGR34479.1 MAG: inositol monophosphatase [Desulfuromonadales bacterium GWD2_61_12]HAD03864.1 inositol monophosphatase [Desulfuromonas sp.]HBT82863.1 inositol monophosphatase [Desulfuromonas sp.]